MSKKLRYFLLFFVGGVTFCFAQQKTRWAFDLNAGVPVPLFSIKSDITTFGGVGVKYNIVPLISVGFSANVGTFSGKQTVVTPDLNDLKSNGNVVSYNTSFRQLVFKGYFNLEKALGLRRVFHRINPYLVFGAGYTNIDAQTNYFNGTENKYNVNLYTDYGGIQFRYYMNPTLDFCFGSELHHTQSFFVDGAPTDKKTDMFLLNNIGISYKLGARKDKQHTEWSNVILRDRIYIPDIEKRQGQPVDAAGNFFIFHKDSIARLQAQNIELQNKTTQLETKAAELETKDVAQQKQIDSMQNEFRTMRMMMDTMRARVVEVPVSTQVTPVTPVVVEPVPPIPPPNVKDTMALQRQNIELRNKAAKMEAQLNTQQKQINNLQKQINELQQSMNSRPEKRTPPPAESPSGTEVAPAPVTPEKTRPSRPSGEKQNTPAGRERPAAAEQPAGNDATAPGDMPSNSLTEGLNKIDNVVPPVARYNVIAGAYAGEKYAFIFRDRMRAKGFDAAVFKSDINSRILRVCIFTSEDKREALNVMRRVRSEVDPKAWIHVYYQK